MGMKVILQHVKTWGKHNQNEMWLASVDGKVYRIVTDNLDFPGSTVQGTGRVDYQLFEGDDVSDYVKIDSDRSDHYTGYKIDESGPPSPRKIVDFLADELKLGRRVDFEVGTVERQFDASSRAAMIDQATELQRAELVTLVDKLVVEHAKPLNYRSRGTEGDILDQLTVLYREMQPQQTVEAPALDSPTLSV